MEFRSESERLADFTESLLDLCKYTFVELNHQDVDLSSQASSILQILSKAEPERKFVSRIEAGIIVRGDAKLLHSALENLLNNVWKYTQKQDTSEIEMYIADHQQEFCTIAIRDNGAGFDMDKAQKLFQPFQRMHSTSDYPGTGVGLATVRRIITRHGGKIWAESEPAKGATFSLTLPTPTFNSQVPGP